MDSIKNISIIYNNPFIFSPLFVEFYSSIPQKEKNILLSYLVLPLTLYNPSRVAIKNSQAGSRSTIYSVFSERKTEERIFGLEERIKSYKSLTNNSLQYAISSGMLILNDDLSVSIKNPKLANKKLCQKDALTAARKLGLLFAQYDIPTCFGILGVKEI